MRFRADHKDANEPEIIEALERAGCAVWPMGRPVDLLVYRAGAYYLVEVKNPDGFNRLTKAQKTFRATWPGPWYVVRSPIEALQAVGAIEPSIDERDIA